MWSPRQSLMLSKIFTTLFAVAAVGVLFSAPWLVAWVDRVSDRAVSENIPLFFTTLYMGGAVALLLLFYLFRLLDSLGRDEVFVAKNASLLRRISWCCFVGAGIAGLSMLYYLPWGLVALAAAFVGLIVRVVKNIVVQAILLKDENDYTI